MSSNCRMRMAAVAMLMAFCLTPTSSEAIRLCTAAATLGSPRAPAAGAGELAGPVVPG